MEIIIRNKDKLLSEKLAELVSEKVRAFLVEKMRHFSGRYQGHLRQKAKAAGYNAVVTRVNKSLMNEAPGDETVLLGHNFSPVCLDISLEEAANFSKEDLIQLRHDYIAGFDKAIDLFKEAQDFTDTITWISVTDNPPGEV